MLTGIKSRAELRAVVFAALAAAFAVPEQVEPAAWAAENLIVPDGPRAGQPWDPDLTPYAPEILNCCAVGAPHNVVAVQKSAQVGLTILGVGWLGYCAKTDPANMLAVFPTVQSGSDFNRDKFDKTTEVSPAFRSIFQSVKSRAGDGSTKLRKKFKRGGLTITGANSTADLRSKTIKYLFCDESDDWPEDIGGQGDPMEMADARQISFHATGDWFKLECSTPTTKGQSRIDASFEAGDQRYFQVPCPHCGAFQKLEFGDKDTKHGLKFNQEFPHEAHYVCSANGCIIEHFEKPGMVRAGHWVADNSAPGRYPSFHINALYSLVTTWDMMAAKWIAAQGLYGKLKTFYNLWLGRSYEERIPAPDWERLYSLREDFPARKIPSGGLYITTACDVQMDGIYYEAVAWGLDEQSWSIDYGFLEGDTADPAGQVWKDLDIVYRRDYPNEFGRRYSADLFGIDSGYNSNQVYLWTRNRHKAMALNGVGGWKTPVISREPSKVSVTWRGKKARKGVLLWHIGTYSLKAEMYANLRKEGLKEAQLEDPPGYCHFAEFHEKKYFQQLTAESVVEKLVAGRKVLTWKATGANHLHDCRVYAMALGKRIISIADFPAWARERWRVIPDEQGDLLAAMDAPAVATEPEIQKPSRRRRRVRVVQRPA